MSTMEMVVLLAFGLPIGLLVTAFVVLATWMQVIEPEHTHGKA